MRVERAIQVLATLVALLVVASLVLMVLRKISVWAFWAVIIGSALLAYFGIPWMRKRFVPEKR